MRFNEQSNSEGYSRGKDRPDPGRRLCCLGVIQGVENTTGAGSQSGDSSAANQILETLGAINASNDKLDNTTASQTSYSEEAKNAAEMEQNLDKLERQLKDFRSIDSQVLVSPFKSELVNINNLDLATSDFYAPV